MKSIQKEFKYKDIDIKYMIIKNRIKNVYIHIKSGHIIVKSPIYVSDKKLEELVNKKSEWIYKKLKECEKRENRDTNILENKYLYILGKKINVKFIVKKIFDMAIKGNSTYFIAKYLNTNKYSNPTRYYKTGDIYRNNEEHQWSASKVKAILKNEVMFEE